MEYKAKLSYLHIAPRKVRLVANLVRGLNVQIAQQQLQFIPNRASVPILKLLKSAISNASNINEKIKDEQLFITKITVDEGPKLKRFRPVARGMAHEIQKKTSHITIVLSEKELAISNKKQMTNNRRQTTSKSQINSKTKQKTIIQ